MDWFNTIKLYYKQTDGGAEYLMDTYVVAPNGEKVGVFEGSKYVIRLDGAPELRTLKNDHRK